MKLKTIEIQFMLEVLELQNGLRKRLETLQIKNEELTDEESDMLRDLCGDRLQTHGFDENYEPTDKGSKLEDLIDKLFIG